MSKKALIPIADGIEDIEAVTLIDLLRRADVEVTVAGTNKLQITTAQKIKIVADKLVSACVNETFDLIALPGGSRGAENLRDSQSLISMLKAQQKANRLYAAICASPAVVFQHHGLLSNKTATCYPSLQEKIENFSQNRVVVDGNCITSQGPGTSIELALKLIELLFDSKKSESIANGILAVV